MTKQVLWMQAGTGDEALLDEYAAIDDRRLFSAVFNQQGICNTTGSGDLVVTQRGAGANFSVDVGPGLALVLGDDVSAQGFYLISSDATENVVVPSPPVSGDRIHRLVAQVRDKLHNSGDWSTYEWTLDLIEDDGSGYPDEPDSALTLAQVAVSAGQVSVTNANISDQRRSAVTTLGLGRYVGSDAGRPANPWADERIWRTDKLCDEMYDGTAWREIPRRDGGGSEWTTYTPTLTATSSNPNMGTSPTRQGRYIRVGRTVTCEVILKFGTSPTAGSGFYEISLPVTARTQTIGRRSGSAWTYDNSANEFFDGICFINSAETGKVRLSIDSNVVTHSVPYAWGASDELGFTITYEAAS